MSNLPNMYNFPQGRSIDTIIMEEVIKAFQGEKFCLGSIKGIFSALFAKLPKIVIFILAKKSIESSGAIFAPLFSNLKNAIIGSIYKTKTYVTASAKDIGFYHAKVTKDMLTMTQDSFFPMKIPHDSDGNCVVSYIPYFHSKIIQTVEEKGKEKFDTYTKMKEEKKSSFSILTTMKGSGTFYSKQVPANLFPSTNYKNLASIVQKHFDVCLKIKSNHVLGMLIDGVPGLGKTKFADYASSNGIADEVFKVDMTKFLDIDFDTILSKYFFNKEIVGAGPTIFLFDELDKYLDYSLQKSYKNKKEIHENSQKNFLFESYEDYVSIEKQDFLYKLLSMLEADTFGAPVVILFCCNNFKSIFDGVDVTHYQSLYNRFMKITFHVCDYNELVEYMDYYNSILKTSEITKDMIKEKLRRDISITFRELHHLSIESSYDIEKMIHLLNNKIVYSEILETNTPKKSCVSPTKNRNEPILIEKEENIKLPENLPEKVPDDCYEEISDDCYEEISDDCSEEISDDSYDEYDVMDKVVETPISFDLKKLNDDDYISIFPIHIQMWIKEASLPQSVIDSLVDNTFRSPDLIESIKGKLDVVERTVGVGGKMSKTADLFEALAKHKNITPFLLKNRRFHQIVISKIQELYKHKENPLFVISCPITRRFIYYMTGIDLDQEEKLKL